MFQENQDIRREKFAISSYVDLKGGTFKKLGSNDVDYKLFDDKTCYEFIEWCGLISMTQGTDKLVPHNRIVTNDLYYDFTDTYPDFGPKSKNTVSRQKFHRWLELYGEYKFGVKPEYIFPIPTAGKTIVFKTKHDKEEQTEVPF